jgi:hypothetical protein
VSPLPISEIEEAAMIATHVHLFVELLDSRDLLSAMGPNVLIPPSPATPLHKPSEILTTPGLTQTGTNAISTTLTPTPGVASASSSTDQSGALAAQSIASRTAISSVHQVGVENDLSPLAEAPEGIAVWESADPFARFR